MIITIYRVEMPDGEGPYTNPVLGPKIRWRNALSAEHKNYPSIAEDVILQDSEGWTDKHHCGFSSHEALIAWFEDSWDLLVEHECSVRVYDVPEDEVLLTKSTEQLAFNKDKATISGDWPILGDE